MCELIRFRSRSTSRCKEVVSKRLWASLPQAFQMTFSRGQFDAAQLRLFRNELPGSSHITRHEHAKGESKIFQNALVEFIDLCCAVIGKLNVALDLFRSKFAQILFDNIADVLKVDGKRNNFHRAFASRSSRLLRVRFVR